MEPFGLFQLLNSLLPAQPKTEERETPTPPPPTEEAHAQNAQKSNACLDFFARHDRRAGRK